MNTPQTRTLVAVLIVALVVGAMLIVGGTYDLAGGGPNGQHAGAYEVAAGAFAMFVSLLSGIWAAVTHIQSIITRGQGANDTPAR